MGKSFWVKLDEFPPIACRLLARVPLPSGGVRAMTVDEIADRAGMKPMEVISMSWLPSWKGIPLERVQSFSEACGVYLADRTSLRAHSAYIRRGATFKYLKMSPDWESVFKPLIIAYVRSRA